MEVFGDEGAGIAEVGMMTETVVDGRHLKIDTLEAALRKGAGVLRIAIVTTVTETIAFQRLSRGASQDLIGNEPICSRVS